MAGSSQEEKEQQRMPAFFESVSILFLVGCFIFYVVKVLDAGIHISIALAAAFVAIVAMVRLKAKWSFIERAMLSSIMMGMQAVLILYIVGMLVGTWILSGVVPSMVYYGLNLISPSYFLIATLFICSIVSLATGTSWGTTGTVGIALMGIGTGLGVSAPVTAGFVISGAYFGDKVSPLSDTTNLAPAMAGTDIFQHIRAMCWTTGPAYLIVVVLASVMGSKYSGEVLDSENIQAIQALMRGEFNVSPLGFIPPLLVIGLAASKKPAIPSIFAGVLAGIVLALLQNTGIGVLYEALYNGYSPTLTASVVEAGKEGLPAVAALLAEAGVSGIPTTESALEAASMLNRLMERGGLQSMNETVSLILCALCFGGVLDQCGFLEALLEPALRGVKTVGGLVASTLAACYITNVCAPDQYVSVVIPGRMFKERFEKWGLHPRMLSRSLEDAGTLTSALVPWNTCGLYQAQILGVATIAYAPYAFLNWITPLVAMLITYMGIGIAWSSKDDPEGFVISRRKPD